MGPHELVLSEFLLREMARVLAYPSNAESIPLSDQDISEHVQLLRERWDIVDPAIDTPVVLTDPDDDPVVYTAVIGRADCPLFDGSRFLSS